MWAKKRVADDLDVDANSDYELFLSSSSAHCAIRRFRDDSLKPRRRQDLNIDARADKCGPVGSVSWQPLGRNSMESEPLVAFSTLTDKEVRMCKVLENGKGSSIQYSLKLGRQIAPKIVKFISESELVVSSQLRTGRVAIHNVDSEKTTLYTSLGGRKIVGTRFVVAQEASSLISIAYENGQILNLDRRSKQFASELRLNNPCVGLSWSSCGDILFAGDERANIYQFDSRMNKCVVRNQLETISTMSSFAMNSNSLLACGSPFGTVDVIETSSLTSTGSSPTVSTSFDNLVTQVDSLSFHPIHKSLLLACSREKKNAVRFFECGTGQTMPGWPTTTEVIGRAHNSSFSDCGRFLTIGCKSGRVQLFAL